jgi:16S rRNA processing protein RimM
MGHPNADADRGQGSPEDDSWVEIGEVSRPHSLHGALLVGLYGDDPENLIRSGRVLLRGQPGSVEFKVVSASPAGAARKGRIRIRLTLAGLESREQAEPWASARVHIPAAALRPLPDGEYYWRDILGSRCLTLNGEELGTIEEIWPTAGNDLLVVRGGSRTLLVPALRRVLVRVELERGEVWIDPPEGLLEAES